MTPPPTDLATRLIHSAGTAGILIATAESCTGGWVAKRLTDVAGSSAVVECGFVTYSNRAKSAMLGVLATTLDQYGAVSEAVVSEMALGALNHSDATLSVAISGIAGPGGGSADKPVGTVCLCWAYRHQVVRCETRLFHGSRDDIRRAACDAALSGLLDITEATSQQG